ncbi:MAG TPA: FtsQ-type POTRA domain-containing protein [Anaerolineales bacterium]|nr:FtsQ-type POTRA domain-containing protein [Anaerolineales bacterium]
MTVVESVPEIPRTRAERVRTRRSRVGKPVERAERGPSRTAPRSRRAKRVFELPWPSEIGAGLRLPSLPAFRFGARVLSISMSLLVMVAIINAIRPGSFTVEAAEVTPTELLTESQVRSIAAVDGRAVFLVDPSEVRGRLMEQPEIQSARVVVRWPNVVVLQIDERRPMIEWDDAGRTWWLSADGVAFLKRGELENLIRVTSEEPALDVQREALVPVIEPEALWAAAALLAQVPEVEGLEYHAEHGFGFEAPEGWKAYFGVGGDMVLKVQLYRKISEVLVQRGVEAEAISVEDPAAPYYRKR